MPDIAQMSAFAKFSVSPTRSHRRALPARPVSLGFLTLVALVAVLLPGSRAVADDQSTSRWGWPLSPRPAVVGGFDLPDTPYAAGNRGIDLAGSVGQPVLAVGAGVVTYAGVLAGRGVVVVSHGALRSTYQPVSAAVRVGDDVQLGDRLGTLSAVGSHCLPDACLHLGVIRATTYVDPLSLLPDPAVRLKPLGVEPAVVPTDRSSPESAGPRSIVPTAAAAAAAVADFPWPTVR
jgi:murein DD-endopeptidase MepM/ murein hydrolase activator NlpD